MQPKSSAQTSFLEKVTLSVHLVSGIVLNVAVLPNLHTLSLLCRGGTDTCCLPKATQLASDNLRPDTLPITLIKCTKEINLRTPRTKTDVKQKLINNNLVQAMKISHCNRFF